MSIEKFVEISRDLVDPPDFHANPNPRKRPVEPPNVSFVRPLDDFALQGFKSFTVSQPCPKHDPWMVEDGKSIIFQMNQFRQQNSQRPQFSLFLDTPESFPLASGYQPKAGLSKYYFVHPWINPGDHFLDEYMTMAMYHGLDFNEEPYPYLKIKFNIVSVRDSGHRASFSDSNKVLNMIVCLVRNESQTIELVGTFRKSFRMTSTGSELFSVEFQRTESHVLQISETTPTHNSGGWMEKTPQSKRVKPPHKTKDDRILKLVNEPLSAGNNLIPKDHNPIKLLAKPPSPTLRFRIESIQREDVTIFWINNGVLVKVPPEITTCTWSNSKEDAWLGIP